MYKEEIKFFETYMLLRGLSPRTFETYMRYIRQFLGFIKNYNLPIDQIQKREFDIFMSHLANKGLKTRSLNLILVSIKTFFKILQRDGIIHVNPLMYVVKIRSDNYGYYPEILDVQEMNMLLSSPDISKPKELRDSMILHFIYGSGVRVSEVCNLHPMNINIETGRAKVMGKGRKERMTYLSQDFVDLWPYYWEIYEHPELAFNITRFSICAMVKKHAKRAGLEKNVSPHLIRHAFATHIQQNGAPTEIIQDLLGHSKISTTSAYVHVDQTEMFSDFFKYHPRT